MKTLTVKKPCRRELRLLAMIYFKACFFFGGSFHSAAWHVIFLHPLCILYFRISGLGWKDGKFKVRETEIRVLGVGFNIGKCFADTFESIHIPTRIKVLKINSKFCPSARFFFFR